MSEVSQLVSNYNRIRDRLRFPPNAVPDRGIDLRRHRIPAAPTMPETKEPPVTVVQYLPPVSCSVFLTEVPVRKIENPIRLTDIERAVCAHFGISKIDLYS